MNKETKKFISNSKIPGEMPVNEFLEIAEDLGFTSEKGSNHYKFFHEDLYGNASFPQGSITIGTKHNRGKVVMHYSGVSQFKSAAKQLNK